MDPPQFNYYRWNLYLYNLVTKSVLNYINFRFVVYRTNAWSFSSDPNLLVLWKIPCRPFWFWIMRETGFNSKSAILDSTLTRRSELVFIHRLVSPGLGRLPTVNQLIYLFYPQFNWTRPVVSTYDPNPLMIKPVFLSLDSKKFKGCIFHIFIQFTKKKINRTNSKYFN